jgi:signal transduction histidine kinase
MVVAGRRKTIALFIALGAGIITISVLLYVGWVLLNWRTGILLFLGVLLVAIIVAGVVLNTIFLVREIRRNEQHDAFINAVTHELKTPVASIRLYLQTLQSRPVDEDRRQEFYRIMVEDSDRLLHTIEQVLRTGRMGSSSRKLNVTTFDLSAMVEECVSRAAALHDLDRQRLRYQGGSPVMVEADQDEVRAAVSNLIDNAIKYSVPAVAVRVSIDRTKPETAAVRVEDHGVGIPEAELKRIFKRFYRAPGPHASAVTGTGLGLYIVRSVAKRHRGRAWAESSGPGQGSTFVFELPVTR